MILISVSDVCSIITVAELLCGAAYKLGTKTTVKMQKNNCPQPAS